MHEDKLAKHLSDLPRSFSVLLACPSSVLVLPLTRPHPRYSPAAIPIPTTTRPLPPITPIHLPICPPEHTCQHELIPLVPQVEEDVVTKIM